MNTNPGHQNSIRAKVLMLGPDLSDQGGMVAVEQVYLALWDDSKYDLRHLATFNTSVHQIVKLFIALKAIIYFYYWIALWRPDILHIHVAQGVSFYRKSIFVILAKAMGLKIILHCHGSTFDRYYSRRSKLGQKYIRIILNCADRLLVVAEQWHQYFKSLSLTVPILTLYNPVVCPQDIPRPTNHKRPVVLSLGRLGERKGTFDLLQAVPYVLKICSKVDFWLGGDGEVEQVRKILSTEAWGKKVHLLGWVREEEKKEALSQATIFLLPSYHEGLPVAILEAMAYGLPVISTLVGGIPEAVVDGVTGFLIQPGDIEAMVQKISLLLNNPELREQMGTKAQQRIIEKFEAGAIIQQLYAIYDALMSER